MGLLLHHIDRGAGNLQKLFVYISLRLSENQNKPSLTFSNFVIKSILFFLLCAPLGQAQEYDILIKGGQVFDPKSNIDTMVDVAIAGDLIVALDSNIPPDRAKKVIDANGLWVTPGFIDIHTHVFVGPDAGKFANGINSLSPDDFTFKAGITTVVDAGTAGWMNFDLFKSQVIDQSKTRILSFINIAGSGMRGKPLEEAVDQMQPTEVAQLIEKYPKIIVGVKIGHFEDNSWKPFDLAIRACELAEVPLFVECHLPHYSLADQLNKMRPGDIMTHSFEDISDREPVITEEGKIRPIVRQAMDKGILFDVGHGGAGFWFSQAIPAFEQGLWPHSFGTDLHRFSMNAGMKDMLNVMSKYLAIGMPLKEVFKRATWLPAQSIKREDLGHLTIGSIADITLTGVREGTFGFVDAAHNRIEGKEKLEVELTIREGKVVWDLNGLSATPFAR